MPNSMQDMTASVRFPCNLDAVDPVRSEFADDEDFVELIEFFVAAIPERRNFLVTQLAAGELNDVLVAAHQLKGAGGGYGFDGLSERAAALEEACKLGDLVAVHVTHDDLIRYMSRISL